MKRLHYVLSLVVLIGCHRQNMLNDTRSTNYHEFNHLVQGEQLKLTQDITFDDFDMNGEEFSHDLAFTFLDTAKIKEKRIINLSKDTQFIKSNYSYSTIWSWNDTGNIVTGKLKILQFGKDSITLEEDVKAKNVVRNKVVRFKGRRTFVRKG